MDSFGGAGVAGANAALAATQASFDARSTGDLVEREDFGEIIASL
jgi:hypothetical protein